MVQIWLRESPSVISMRKEFHDQEGGTRRSTMPRPPSKISGCLSPLSRYHLNGVPRSGQPNLCVYTHGFGDAVQGVRGAKR